MLTLVVLVMSSPARSDDFGFTAAQLTDIARVSQSLLTEDALFARCYAHLTRRQLPHNHALRSQVRKGQKSAIDACMSLLAQASLQPSGAKKGLLTEDNAETRAILETFNTFHQSWFPATDFVASVAVGECWSANSSKLYDYGEPALFATRSLFAPSVPFKEIVTGSSSLSAIRSANVSNPRMDKIFKIEDVLDVPTTPVVVPQMGNLLGVVPLADSDRSAPVVANDPFGGWPQSTFNARTHHGGGILGSQPYLILNSGRNFGERMDGGVLQHRRWSSAVYRDLLCRDLPVIRPQDAKAFVQPEAPGRPPFRQGQSCMQCHASLDPMAGTVRNLTIQNWGRNGGECGNAFVMAMPIGDGSKPRESGLVDHDPDFYNRPTYGRLFFRSYDGTLVSKEVKNLAELGAALADTNDLYVCAASRYFRYFTGISVNLQDVGDPSLPPLSAADLNYRNQVITMGLHLKQHQRVDKLIEEIFRSTLYQKSSMRQLAE